LGPFRRGRACEVDQRERNGASLLIERFNLQKAFLWFPPVVSVAFYGLSGLLQCVAGKAGQNPNRDVEMKPFNLEKKRKKKKKEKRKKKKKKRICFKIANPPTPHLK
jgi:hypothetical protein